MTDSPVILAGISLAASLIPAALGVYSWGRRGKPGTPTLAVLMFSLSVWGLAHSLGFIITGSTFLLVLLITAEISKAVNNGLHGEDVIEPGY